MRSPLAKLVAASLLLLCVVQPRTTSHNRAQPPPASSLDWGGLADAKLWRDTQLLSDVIAWNDAARQGTASSAVKEAPKATEESQHVAHFDPGSVQQLIVDVFGPAAPEALHVARCESNFRADAVNGRYRGVFQIGEMHAAGWLEVTGRDYWESWMLPEANLAYAYSLYLAAGWGPWSCRP